MSHNRSLFRSVRAGGTFPQDFLAVAPVLHTGETFAAQGQLIVKGSIWINGKPQNLDNRWAVTPDTMLAEGVKIALKDKTITKTQILSVTAGNARGVGSTTGYVMYFTGSDEAKAFAEKYSLVNELTVTVGRQNEISVTHRNALMCTQDALIQALKIQPLAAIPGIEREMEMPDRVDGNNPDLLDLIQFVKVQGKLPERNRVARGNVDEAFAAQFS